MLLGLLNKIGAALFFIDFLFSLWIERLFLPDANAGQE